MRLQKKQKKKNSCLQFLSAYLSVTALLLPRQQTILSCMAFSVYEVVCVIFSMVCM